MKKWMRLTSLFIAAGLQTPFALGQTATELAGNPLSQFPFFEYVRAFNANTAVSGAIDTGRFPDIIGRTCDLYVTDSKSAAQWTADNTLTDVTPGGKQTQVFSAADIQANTFQLTNSGDLSADIGSGLGVGYDIVFDCDLNGILSSVDYIDGIKDEAGLYSVHDTSSSGPFAVTELEYQLGEAIGLSFDIPAFKLGQNLFFPSNIDSLGQLPLIIVSRGNGHDFRWYDHIGNHLASYGYIVMSHDNNTEPGPQSAAITTLGHTDAFIDLAQSGTIASGDLVGHLDTSNLVWIGHSRGGEGVAIAYDRLINGSYTPDNYQSENIKLISSMLPTDFYGTGWESSDLGNAPLLGIADPHSANFHLWTASGDADVNGGADCPLCQTFHLHDRAEKYRQSTVVQGAGHGWFHNNEFANPAFTGPCAIGPPNDTTHDILLGHLLPLVKYYVDDNIPALDFLTRQYERFRPIGVSQTNACIVVSHEHRNGSSLGNFVVDDFQTQPNANISSSGAQVLFDVDNLTEGKLDDNNTSFNWLASDPFNGATQAHSSDDSSGVAFDWTNDDHFYEWEVATGRRDFTAHTHFSFRAAQGTQHPNTLASMGDLTFSVTLKDLNGNTSSINIGAYGGGLEQPYARSGGWHNEMESIHIRLTDFLNNGRTLDLSNIVGVRLDVGPSWGSAQGRIVVDDVMLTNFASPNAQDRPVLRVSELVLDYGEVELGFGFSKAIVIHNDGTAPLTYNVQITTAAGNPNLNHWNNNTASGTINAGGLPVVIRQTYEPQALGNHLMQMSVQSNDAAAPTVPVTLLGEGVTPIPLDSMLVLDRSGSMSQQAGERTKIEALQSAAQLYTDLQRPNIGGTGLGDKLGFWKYNHNNSQYLMLDFVSEADKSNIANNELGNAAMSDATRLGPDGNTGIGGAMQNGATAIGGPIADRKQVMIVLTDGIENVSPYIDSVLGPIQSNNSNLQLYSVGLGSNIEAAKLQSITNMGTEGYHQISDSLTGENLFDLENFYFKIFTNATGMDLVVDPTHVVNISSLDPILVDSAHIISSDRNANFLVLDDPALRGFYDLEFISPKGEVLKPGVSVGGIPIQVTTRGKYRIYRITFPSVSEAANYVGDWSLVLRPNGKWSPSNAKEALANSSIRIGDLIDPIQGLIPVGFSAAVTSNYKLNVSVLPDGFLPGASVRLEAKLTDRGWPMPDGLVHVNVTNPDGNFQSMTLYDNGTHGDSVAGDAVWTNSFQQTSQAGVYRFLFRSNGHNQRGELAPREASRFVTLKVKEPTPNDPTVPGGGSNNDGNAVSSYLVGSFDLRESSTLLHIMNPTPKKLQVLVALFSEEGDGLRCEKFGILPNGLIEVPIKELQPRKSIGVIKVVSLDAENRIPTDGVVANQRLFYSEGAVSETNLHPVSDSILRDDIKRIFNVCS